MRVGPIVLATDLDDGAVGAAIWARDMSHRTGQPVVVVHVVELGFDNWLHGKYQIHDNDEMRAEAMAEVTAWHEQATGGRAEEAEVRVGHVVTELRKVAAEHNASMLVLAATAKGALTRLVVGSRVQQLIEDPPVPVVVVHPEHHTVVEPPKVVAAVDFSRATDEVVAIGGTLAKLASGELTLAYALEKPAGLRRKPEAWEARKAQLEEAAHRELDQLSDRVLPGYAPIGHAVLDGSPADALCAYARETGVDILVLGHSGHAPSAARALLGSTPRKLTGEQPCTLIIAPVPAAGEGE